MSEYLSRVIEETKSKNANETEFLQALEEVLTALEPVIAQHEEFEKVMKRKNHKGFEKNLVDSNERIHAIPYVSGGKI